MIPAKFDYLAPTSVEEALSALAESEEAKVKNINKIIKQK